MEILWQRYLETKNEQWKKRKVDVFLGEKVDVKGTKNKKKETGLLVHQYKGNEPT